MIRVFKYFLQSLIIYIFLILGRLLGLKISRKVFSFLFSKIGPIIKSKKVFNKNLDIFSSIVNNIDRKKLSNDMWSNYGKTFIEYIFLNQFLKNNSHINLSRKKNLNQAKKNKKPIIFISGHFANYELMSMEIIKQDIKLATVYRPLNNIFLNPLMEFLRKKYVCNNQIKKGISGVRNIVTYLKENYSIALMIDQRLSEGEKITFFGRKALTTTLPAQLAFKFNLDIVPVFIKREINDKFTIEFQKPLNTKNFKNKIELTEELNRVLEKMIIKNPSQWIWTHNRWK